MHTFLVFFGWPMGAVWGNLLASVLVAVWVTAQARSVKALHAEIAAMHVRHHEEQMAALSGARDAVMSVTRDAKTAAESAHSAVRGLALITGNAEPATGKTPMKRTAGGRFAPRDKNEEGTS